MVKFSPSPNLGVISLDATTSDPFWTDDNYYTGGNNRPDKIGKQIPKFLMISEQDLNAASLTPFGYFIVEISTQLSFKDGWNYISPDNPDEPPGKHTMSRLEAIDKQFDMKSIAMACIAEAKRYGRSATCKLVLGKNTQKARTQLRVTRLPEGWVTYDTETGIPLDEQEGRPVRIKPILPWGKGSTNADFEEDEFRVCINRKDPAGNGWQGTPELIAVYRILKWDQNVLHAYDTVINQRGLGLLDVTIQGLRDEDGAKDWARKWGNPAQYAGLFHSDRITVETKEGMKANYNIADVSEVHRHYTSAGTGYPGERMIGVQTGAITGSQTDRDNMAEIYRTNHDMFDEFIISLYTLIDPELEGKFKLEFPINAKLDKETEAGILSDMNDVVKSSLDYMKVSVAEQLLDYEITDVESEKGMFMTEWLLLQEKKLRGKYPDLFEQQEEEQGPPGGDDQQQQQQQQKKKDIKEREQEDNKARRNTTVEKDMMETFAKLPKMVVADLLMNAGFSLNETNEKLRAIHGSGYDKNVLVDIRKERGEYAPV